MKASVTFSPDQYRHHLKPLDLTKEQETEILNFLHTMMENFVSIAYDKNPVQQAMQSRKSGARRGLGDLIEYKHPTKGGDACK